MKYYLTLFLFSIGVLLSFSFQKNNTSALTSLLDQPPPPSKQFFSDYNLLSSCELTNLNGEILEVFPGFLCSPTPDGFIVSQIGNYFHKFDRNLNIRWKLDLKVHHDFTFDSDNNIYALSSEIKILNKKNFHFGTIVKIDPNGKISNSWKSFDHLDELSEVFLQKIDSFHAFKKGTRGDAPTKIKINSISVIPKNKYESNFPFMRHGNLLVGFSQFHTLAILDKTTYKILWSLTYPAHGKYFSHSAQMLPEGNILLFNNTSSKLKTSSLLKINPITKTEAWVYEGFNFYSPTEGDVQQLPNDNILFTYNTNGGRSTEITPSGKIIWTGENPYKNIKNFKPLALYRTRRISADFANQNLLPTPTSLPSSLKNHDASTFANYIISTSDFKNSSALEKALYKINEDQLLIEQFGKNTDFERLISDRVELLKNLFDPPYFDHQTLLVRSQRPTCTPNFTSKSSDDKVTYKEYYSIAVNNKNAPVICQPHTGSRIHSLIFLKCSKLNKMFTFHYFTESVSRMEYFFNELSCQNLI